MRPWPFVRAFLPSSLWSIRLIGLEVEINGIGVQDCEDFFFVHLGGLSFNMGVGEQALSLSVRAFVWVYL